MAARFVCFGEMLLRLTAGDRQRLAQASRFEADCGGAEANVGVSLSRFGHDVSMVTALPDNTLAEGLLSALKAQGVDTRHIQMREGRLGLYFMEPGAVRRPSRIVYDRAGSVFASLAPEAYDWPAILEGADWLHVSGITPAVGPNPSKAALAAVEAAEAAGVKVAFDGNYREALWKSWAGDGPAILRDILSCASAAFINERDIALILGGEVMPRDEAIARAFDTFGTLETIAATTRDQTSVSQQSLTGSLYTREGHWVSKTHEMADVVDRIGGGDAFAAGVLHGLAEDLDPQACIDFATAASVIKHSIPGDWNITNVNEVMAALVDDGLDVKR